MTVRELDRSPARHTAFEGGAADQAAVLDSTRPPRSERRLAWEMALAVFLVATSVFALSPVITNYDSFATLPTAVSIVNRHTLSLDAYRHVKVLATSYTVGHAKGHLLTTYPWAVGLFMVPAVVGLDALHALGGPSADSVVAGTSQVGPQIQLWTASIVTGLACATLSLLAYRRLRGPARKRRHWALFCGLALAFGTSAWSTASRALWQHGPSLLFLAVALVALDHLFPRNPDGKHVRPDAGWAPFVAGGALAAAVAMRPTNAVALGLATVLVLWKGPGRSRFPYLIGVCIVFVPWALVTLHYYGSVLQPYDAASKLGLPPTFFESIAAQLVSPSRGLLLFSPIVLAAVPGLVIARKRAAVTPLEVLSVVAIPCYLVAIALFPVWWAGTSFGPRFMTETLPFFFVLSVPFVEWLMTWRSARPASRPLAYRMGVVGCIIIVAFSVMVNAQGGLLSASTCWNLKGHHVESVDKDPARAWSWSNPQLVYGFRALGSEGLAAISTCPGGIALP